MPAHPIVTFEDPPVNEVALGRTFLLRPDFLLPHFGGFWQRVSSKYPKPEHAPPIFDGNMATAEPWFLPRVWLVSRDSSTLIQVQQDRFHFNWRQTSEKNPYVRFSVVQHEYLESWATFQSYLKEVTGEPAQPVNAELTYVNLITMEGVTDSLVILQKALRDFKIDDGQRFLPRPQSASVVFAYQIPDTEDSFRVNISPVTKKATGEVAVKLELSVTGKCLDDAAFEQWSSKAHDFLVRGFTDLTSSEMHNLWKYKA